MTFEEAVEYINSKIKDLEDDFSHEKYVEGNDLQALKITWEIEDWNNVLNVIKGNKKDEKNNAKDFLYDKISVLEEELTEEKDRVRISYLKYDLDKYNGVLELSRRIEAED